MDRLGPEVQGALRTLICSCPFLLTSVPSIEMWSPLSVLVSGNQPLVSLVSASGRNWCYLCGTVEGVEKGEIVEIANIHAVLVHVAEKMVGWRKDLAENPTLSAIPAITANQVSE